MDINFYNKILEVFYSIILGCVLGTTFDIISIPVYVFEIVKIEIEAKRIRIASENNKAPIKILLLFLYDLLRFVFASMLIAIFVFGVNNGVVRWYIIFGVISGYVVYKKTLGRLLGFIILYISYFFKLFMSKISKILIAFLKKTIKKAPHKYNKIYKNKKRIFHIGI